MSVSTLSNDPADSGSDQKDVLFSNSATLRHAGRKIKLIMQISFATSDQSEAALDHWQWSCGQHVKPSHSGCWRDGVFNSLVPSSQ